jgi:hypothetical protein
MIFAAIGLIMIFHFIGCAGYGKIKQASMAGDPMTIQVLAENWQDYHISYSGFSIDRPLGLLFDPKNDDKTIVSQNWTKILDGKTLSNVIGWMDTFGARRARLFVIYGADNQFYGYIYTFLTGVTTKQVGENTLSIYRLESLVRDRK